MWIWGWYMVPVLHASLPAVVINMLLWEPLSLGPADGGDGC
jgi:hypothetical protein